MLQGPSALERVSGLELTTGKSKQIDILSLLNFTEGQQIPLTENGKVPGEVIFTVLPIQRRVSSTSDNPLLPLLPDKC